MPHVIVKLWPGESEQQKKNLAAEITKAVMATLHYGEESVSVAMEEVKAADWTEKSTSPISSPSATRSTKSQGTRSDCPGIVPFIARLRPLRGDGAAH